MSKVLPLNLEPRVGRELLFLREVHRLEQESLDLFGVQVLDNLLLRVPHYTFGLLLWPPNRNISRWVRLESEGRALSPREVLESRFESLFLWIRCGLFTASRCCRSWSCWSWFRRRATLIEGALSLVLLLHLCKGDGHALRPDWQCVRLERSCRIAMLWATGWAPTRARGSLFCLLTWLPSQLTEYLVFSDRILQGYPAYSLDQGFLLLFWVYHYLSVPCCHPYGSLPPLGAHRHRTLRLLLLGALQSRLCLLFELSERVLQRIRLH